jgi:hypothetical protein
MRQVFLSLVASLLTTLTDDSRPPVKAARQRTRCGEIAARSVARHGDADMDRRTAEK